MLIADMWTMLSLTASSLAGLHLYEKVCSGAYS